MKKTPTSPDQLLQWVQSQSNYFCALGVCYGRWELSPDSEKFGTFYLLDKEPLEIPCHVFTSVLRHKPQASTPQWYQVYPSMFKKEIRLSLVNAIKSNPPKQNNYFKDLIEVLEDSELLEKTKKESNGFIDLDEYIRFRKSKENSKPKAKRKSVSRKRLSVQNKTGQ